MKPLEYVWKAAEDLHPTLPARQTHVADMARTIWKATPAASWLT
ncbi:MULTISPECIES: hypothetical protein [unclassified Streptomyces]